MKMTCFKATKQEYDFFNNFFKNRHLNKSAIIRDLLKNYIQEQLTKEGK